MRHSTIGEICNIKTGKLDANASSPNGQYPFFTCSREVLRIDHYAYDAECVLIAGNGELNVKYYNGKFNAYQRTYIITLKPTVQDISVKYLYTFFTKYIETLRKDSIGGVIKYIKLGNLTDAVIPVPPIAEQEKIVAELDCLTGIIDKKKQQLEELDKLAQSIFYDMFGNPIANEKGWVVKCVGEICSLKSGNSNANNSSPGDLPYVKVGDMGIPGNERSITTSSQFVSRDDNKKGIFPIGTTIFPKRGGAIYTNKKRLTSIEICCDLNTMGVIPNKDVLHPLYLFQFFLGLDLGTLCNGAAIPQLNNCDIAPLRIEVPPLDLQNEFARKIEAIEKQKELVKRSIVETETLFNSRMEYWFN